MQWNATRCAIAVALAWLLVATPGSALEDDEGPTFSGWAELGGRTVTGDFGSAKYEEYRDLRPGLFGNLHFLVEDGEQEDFFRGWLTKIGEHDQRYELEAGRWGIGRLRLFYGELPVPLSNQARSPYLSGSDALRLPPGFQERVGMFTGALRSQVLRSELADTARPVRLGHQLKQGEADLSTMLLPGLELAAGYRIWDRQGTSPLGVGFGSPGGNFAVVPAPLDQQIHEVTSAIRMARELWNLELQYVGSWFENDVDALRVDNPLTAVDRTSAAAVGQISRSPDNEAHNFQLTSGLALPIGIPARLTVTGGYGFRLQDEDFLPHTINSAILAMPTAGLLDLPQDSLEGEVETWLANVLLTAEPVRNVDLDFHYRYYRYDNETQAIAFPAHVVNDQGFTAETLIAEPNSYSRHDADASVGWQVVDPVRFELGYEFERWSRDESRNVRDTDEHGGHAAVTVVAGPSLRFNAVYEAAVRRKDDYDPFASIENMHLPSELDDMTRLNFQLPELRKYSQADRKRQEAALIATWLPLDSLDVTLSVNWAQNDFDHTDYGVKDHEAYSAGIDVGYQATDWLRVFGGYTFTDSEYRMRGRWRPRSFAPPVTLVDDVRNDWSTDSEERAHFFNLGGTIDLIPDRLELELSYLIQDAEAQTRSESRPGFLPAPPVTPTASDGGFAPDYPDIEDTYQFFQAIARYRVSDRWTLKGGWRWEKFATQNYKLDDLDPFEPTSNISGSGVISPSNDIFLGNRIGDYDAHIFMLSVELSF